MLSVEPKAEADNIYWDLDFPDNTKKESNNCLVILRFEKKKRKRQENDKHTVSHAEQSLTLLLEITHCARKLQISH